MSKRILCLLAPGFEEIEMVTPVDLLRRAGAEVVLASLDENISVTGRTGITMRADTSLTDAIKESFDLLFIPGGPGVAALRHDGRPADLARSYAADGKPVAAICAAPTVLHDAGLLADRKYTAHFSVHNELTNALGDERIVVDGNIITSRGAGTALDFGLELVRYLFGDEAKQKVATSIMA